MEYRKLQTYCKALTTYAEKVHGELWEETINFEVIKAEFDEWLAGKGDDKAYPNVSYDAYKNIMASLPTPTPSIGDFGAVLERWSKRARGE